MMAVGVSRTQSKEFRATLERFTGNNLNWVIVRLPFSVERVWGTRGMFRVVVEVNGFEYRTSLFPSGDGRHYLLVNKTAQKGARIIPGSVAKFTLTPDLSPREVKMPIELERALNQDRAVRKWFDRLNYSVRKWLADIVSTAKSPETRTRRAERMAEQLMGVMDAELELPPMIRLAFNRNPGAEKGWRKMTETQRRGHLLSIFYHRTPQSRLRRIEKLIEQLLTREESQSD
jgi:hypothetical protein